eukprot:Nitzschia sp. Nitz4//scaffold96_size78090//75976//77667//NITZ4_005510-RA/size78090-processed-gene-0.37-mRNA-1//1//CDS//3329560621//7127//frame0
MMRATDESAGLAVLPRAHHPSPITDSSNTRANNACGAASAKRGSRPPMGPTPSRKHPVQPSHFLSEFNVDDCSDVRHIPDPPTPQPRNRRRLSSPLILPSKSSSSDPADDTENLPQNMSNKRSRRSLCHIPSPSPLETRPEPLESVPTDAPPPSTTLQIEFVHTDEEAEARSKRRKKRQSMELPRDWVQQNAHTLVDESVVGKPQSPAEQFKSKPFAGDWQSLKDLQALVRNYCKTPKDQRATSSFAKEIHSTTNYPLSQPTLESHPLSQSNKRAVIQGMGPVIKEIDRRKAEDTQKWEHETGCRVERSKSGRYRYMSISTNTKVGSQEYKRRYMAVLDREAWDRLVRANAWKEKLYRTRKVSKPAAMPLVVHPEAQHQPEILEPVDSSSDTEADTDYAITQELDLSAVLDDVLPSLQQPCNNTVETSMEICDTSSSMDLGDVNLPSEFEPPRSKLLDKPHAPTSPVSEKIALLPMTTAEEETTIKPTVSNDVEPDTFHSTKTDESDSTPLLPFPDRESGSKDPEIARAEQKLWDRIDSALQEYSSEVISIMKSRKAREQSHQ